MLLRLLRQVIRSRLVIIDKKIEMGNEKNRGKKSNSSKKKPEKKKKNNIFTEEVVKESLQDVDVDEIPTNNEIKLTDADKENTEVVEDCNEGACKDGKAGLGWTIGIALAASLGLAISVYLTIHHYQIMSGLPDYQSFCSISEYIDCDMVNTSSYSEFRGLPVALFGAGIYACVVCLIILSIFAGGTTLKRYISAISILGLVSFCGSIYFAIVSTFILHAICILCVGTYLINLFIFLGGTAAIRNVDNGRFNPVRSVVAMFRASRSGEGVAIGNALGVFAIIMVVIQGFLSAIYLDAKYLGFTESDIASFKEKYMAIKPQKIDLADSPYWGTDDPDLTIVIFEDFLCHFCKRSHVTAFPIFKEYKNRIKIVFKHLPYDKACNRSLQKTIHPGACRSAVAAACASIQGEFARFQEYFFSNQDVIKPDMDIAKVASEIGGVDMDEFKSCLDQGKGEWVIQKDFNEAMKLTVRRTPAYFFNGRKWEGALKPIFIKRILEWELKLKE